VVIGLYLSGRLGNQFFRYAFSRAIMAKCGIGKLVCNFSHLQKKGFEDALKDFNVLPYETDNSNLEMKYGDLQQKIQYLIYCLFFRAKGKLFKRREQDVDEWYERMSRYGLIYAIVQHGRKDYVIPDKKTIIVGGNFENSKYFNDIRPLLLKEFTPKYAPLEHNKQLYEVINSGNSICVTIRRGDYLRPENRRTLFLCDEAYFNKAIERMKSLISHPVFVFFSDDIEWVKSTFEVEGVPCYYEQGNDPIWEKLRLMYSCKHFIISNSTFSWWAQYLSRNENKVVISPNRWYNAPYKSPLIEDSFITIEV
jgi:hypothetical protein